MTRRESLIAMLGAVLGVKPRPRFDLPIKPGMQELFSRMMPILLARMERDQAAAKAWVDCVNRWVTHGP